MPRKRCKVPFCGEPIMACDLCSMHYQRERRGATKVVKNDTAAAFVMAPRPALVREVVTEIEERKWNERQSSRAT